MFNHVIESMKNLLNKPDEKRVLERVSVNFDLARSKTFTSNFINIFLRIKIIKKEER
jgi:hypothetical protein